jgi:hypothetical protein
MMISKNQGGNRFNTSFGVLIISLGALMTVDALTGGSVREYYGLRMIQYGVMTIAAIAVLGDSIKETELGVRLLRSYSRHGL